MKNYSLRSECAWNMSPTYKLTSSFKSREWPWDSQIVDKL